MRGSICMSHCIQSSPCLIHTISMLRPPALRTIEFLLLYLDNVNCSLFDCQLDHISNRSTLSIGSSSMCPHPRADPIIDTHISFACRIYALFERKLLVCLTCNVSQRTSLHFSLLLFQKDSRPSSWMLIPNRKYFIQLLQSILCIFPNCSTEHLAFSSFCWLATKIPARPTSCVALLWVFRLPIEIMCYRSKPTGWYLQLLLRCNDWCRFRKAIEVMDAQSVAMTKTSSCAANTQPRHRWRANQASDCWCCTLKGQSSRWFFDCSGTVQVRSDFAQSYPATTAAPTAFSLFMMSPTWLFPTISTVNWFLFFIFFGKLILLSTSGVIRACQVLAEWGRESCWQRRPQNSCREQSRPENCQSCCQWRRQGSTLLSTECIGLNDCSCLERASPMLTASIISRQAQRTPQTSCLPSKQWPHLSWGGMINSRPFWFDLLDCSVSSFVRPTEALQKQAQLAYAPSLSKLRSISI